ncbi:unnamed protein product [Urochloa humidicola]
MAPGPGLLGPSPVGLGRTLSTALSAGGGGGGCKRPRGRGGGGCKRPRWGFLRPRGGGSSADDRWDLHKRKSVAVVSTNNGKMGAASDKIGKRSESTNNGKMGAVSDKIGKRSDEEEEEGEEIVYVGRMK